MATELTVVNLQACGRALIVETRAVTMQLQQQRFSSCRTSTSSIYRSGAIRKRRDRKGDADGRYSTESECQVNIPVGRWWMPVNATRQRRHLESNSESNMAVIRC